MLNKLLLILLSSCFTLFAANPNACPSPSSQDWQSLIKAIESANIDTVKAIIPTKIDIHQKTLGGKTSLQIAQFWLEKRKAIVAYMNSVTSGAKSSAATGNDWDNLIKAIEQADLSNIQSIIPHKILPTESTRSGRPVLKIAQYYQDRQEQIVHYLNSLTQAGPSSANNVITFYHKGHPYYEFTNFYHAPIVIDGKTWATTEHYFQAQKFIAHPDIQNQISGLALPSEAFKLARANDHLKRQDWDAAKDDIMKKALHAKFTQHPNLKTLLRNTGTAMLIEASDVDAYWGWGPAPHNGQNKLGKFLMELRSIL